LANKSVCGERLARRRGIIDAGFAAGGVGELGFEGAARVDVAGEDFEMDFAVACGAGDFVENGTQVTTGGAANPQAGPQGVVFLDVVVEPTDAALVEGVGGEGVESAAVAGAGAGHRVTVTVGETKGPQQPRMAVIRNVRAKGEQLVEDGA
jgi:hypothetical protein